MLLLSSNAFADGLYQSGYLLYTINNNEITIVNYIGNETNVKVPMAIGNYYVTTIADNAFANTNIKKVELPETITTISDKAFSTGNAVSVLFFDEDGNTTARKYTTTKTEPTVDDKDKPVTPVTPTDDDKDKDKPVTPATPSTDDKDKDKPVTPVDDKDKDNPISPSDDIKDDPNSNTSSSDSSGSVKEGDTIDDHRDMISDIYVSIKELFGGDEKEEIDNIENKDDNVSSSNTTNIVSSNNTNNSSSNETTTETVTNNSSFNVIYIIVGASLAGAAYYYIVKKKKE